ncbi:DUF2169 family type VI secretion system accessory protein [Candidatus Thiosymbion oneisti]|uniref:DUF2169 family type VI secretion system accessory protein n=1 Tax=Candidatus Thiosymbion oneisti TaxID=589554 RepID=UPI001414F0D4|nr:DUF2169 domain-containing protein [Candidatus Thiosymbion oneisti]
MLQTTDYTPFVTALAVFPDQEGVDTAFSVTKGTFDIGPEGIQVAEEQLPVVRADECWDEPGTSSIRYAAELGFTKPATDIVMTGHAYAPAERRVTSIDVGLMVGSRRKIIRVFGDRCWDRTLGIAHFTDPLPFAEMPLRYERAFGGRDQVSGRDGPQPRVYAANPIGHGFRVRGGEQALTGMPLPNLEDPKHLIDSPKDRPPPAGFGYIHPHWEPRRRYAGTYDEHWKKNRAPYLPADFDPRFNQAAHPDLIADGYLKGGEEVKIVNASKSGLLHFQLPRIRLSADFMIDGALHTRTPVWDTLVLEPDRHRFIAVWRASIPCDKQVLRVREVVVRCLDADIDLGIDLG